MRTELTANEWDSVARAVLRSEYDNWHPLWDVENEEGAPAYSIYSQGKAVRVVVRGSNQNGYGIWVKETQTSEGDSLNELVCTFHPDQYGYFLFSFFLRIWVHPRTDKLYMDDLIDRIQINFLHSFTE